MQGAQNFSSAPQPQDVHPPPLPLYPPQCAPLRPTEWSSNLCDCCSDLPVCCLTLCCPCIAFGQIAEIVDEGSPPRFVSSGIYSLLLHFTGVPCWYSCSYRNKMRVKFNLFGSPGNDCLVHSFCESCALCQEYRELKHLGYRPDLGWKGNLQRQERKMGASMAAPACPTMAK